MDKRHCTILVADDDKYIRDDLGDLLRDACDQVLFSATAKETWEAVSQQKPDLVLLDIKFPDLSDLSLLQRIKTEAPGTEVIILTSQSENVEQIVSAIKLGAFDYVPKPFIGAELLNRIAKALDQQQLARSQERLLKEVEERSGLDCLVGDSAMMRQMRETIRRLAGADGCVLIRGESGTGKELAARALHYLSKRRGNPFIAVNCASIPEALVESAFFGHRRGAFTGAIADSKGKFEAAGEGTVFLDEIGDMPLAQQASLLRVLEYRRFTPVGDMRERECLARFVFATNRDLRESVRRGEFREDLFYRINVAALALPALKARPEDIPQLVEYFRQRLSAEMGRPPVKIAAEVIGLFQRYDWPGNVRELKHILEGAMMLTGPEQGEITMQDLPPEVLAARDSPGAGPLADTGLLEKQELIRALQQAKGNQTVAARLMGMHRNTVRAKIRYYGIANPGEE